MYANASPFDRASAATPVPGYIRATGQVRVGFGRAGPRTTPLGVVETGGLRIRFPNAEGPLQGVLVNSAGGLAGGDRMDVDCRLDRGASAILTTQSAEKIYRADTAPAQVAVRLSLDERAALCWLPQETILFDGARVARTLDVTLAASAKLTLLEIVVFGRIARGEDLTRGLFRDRWRVRRAGRLVLAEDVYLDGPIAETLGSAAAGRGVRAIATLVHIAGKSAARLAGLRRILAGAACRCGASAWNDMIVARFAGADPMRLRRDALAAARHFMPGPAPRVWSI
jgi:urease accessory protein